jgi:predicted TIM-barrel fold metal-dependent hydrolase
MPFTQPSPMVRKLITLAAFLFSGVGPWGMIGFGMMSFARAEAAPSASENRLPVFDEIPKIDIHVHVFDDVPEFAEMLRRTRMRVVNICVGGSQPELLLPCEKRAEQFRQQYAPCFGFASTFDLTQRNQPEYARQVTNWLEATFQAGAALVKIWKDVGMQLKTPTGQFLQPDDAVFDPIYRYLTEKGRPLMTHFADPIEAWRPLDPASPHYSYYTSHPEWHVYGKSGVPSHALILSACDRVLAKHSNLVMIAAHLGSQAHDLDGLGKRLDRFPNLYVDVAARTPELQRQPAERVRHFFLRYQDRILYGTDADQYTANRPPTPEERTAFARKMEQWYRQEFDYYSGRGVLRLGGQSVECLGLPHAVLEKFYYRNAQRLIPRLNSE